jgi:hypothetical protein
MDDFKSILLWNQRIYSLASNYLTSNGWFNNRPADLDGYTPWFTYPAISFLKDIISKEFKVLEFGSGFGTLFFNKNAGECLSVEHDGLWSNHLLSLDSKMEIVVCGEGTEPLPQSIEYLNAFIAENFEMPISSDRRHNVQHGLINLEFSGYASQITGFKKGYFDVVVIDGMARLLTGYLAANFVSDTGYIILDNSDRWQYNSLQRYLIQNGFGRIDFWGPGPVNDYPWCTSIFSRRFEIKNNFIERAHKSGELGW